MPPPPGKNPLAFVEHYHWGMLAMLLASRMKRYNEFLTGAGSGLILTDAAQEHPFGIGKSEYEMQGNVALTSLLAGLIMISYASR